MESSTTLNIFLIFVALSGCGYFSNKIIDWYAKFRYERFKDDSAEFISDLYKLKQKWTQRGEYLYCEALDSVIKAEIYSKIPDQEAETKYGQDVKKQMAQMMNNESSKFLNELT